MIWWRFTLRHSTLGELEVGPPDGWDKAVLRFERDKKFHSLVKYFNGTFIWYRTTGGVDGGYNFIKSADAIGIDEFLEVLIDYSRDSFTYKNIFTGQIDLENLRELPSGKYRRLLFEVIYGQSLYHDWIHP